MEFLGLCKYPHQIDLKVKAHKAGALGIPVFNIDWIRITESDNHRFTGKGDDRVTN